MLSSYPFLMLLFMSIPTFTGITYAYPSIIDTFHWVSVERTLHEPDIIQLWRCLPSGCNQISGTEQMKSQGKECSCQCKKTTPIFLPSIHACIAYLDECQRQIPFLATDMQKLWIPTFSIPATGGIFAPIEDLSWNDENSSKRKGRIESNCSIRNIFVQTDGLWTMKNDSTLFKLETYNHTVYLVWKGDETEAKRIEGSIVQLKVLCTNLGTTIPCMALRIAGIRENLNAAVRLGDIQWNRVELVICILLSILLASTICGGIALWKVCWRSKKSKLISAMQIQFLYHMKQQQARVQEQISSICANANKHTNYGSEDEKPPNPTVMTLQKRRLYFSTEFFEPELMANPPPLASQFLYELRKMIDIAKDRIRMKRHVPTLTTIIEDSENDKHLEIPPPTSQINERIEEPSPKSVNSTDSGCDSLSDDEAALDLMHTDTSEMPEDNYKALQSELSTSANITSENGLSTTAIKNDISRPSVVKAERVRILPSRIPTISSSRIPYSTAIPTRSTSRTEHSFSGENHFACTSNGSVADCSSKIPPVSPVRTRSPPNLEHILSNVPPPLPETNPPLVPSSLKNGFSYGKRKTYAVFPSSDTTLKRSLPRRTRRQHQRSIGSITTNPDTKTS